MQPVWCRATNTEEYALFIHVSLPASRDTEVFWEVEEQGTGTLVDFTFVGGDSEVHSLFCNLCDIAEKVIWSWLIYLVKSWHPFFTLAM